MKFIIAALLLVSALAMAFLAQANEFKSVSDCRSQKGGSLQCNDCCEQFGLVGVYGRHSLRPLADYHICKCITKEEDQKRQDEVQAYYSQAYHN